MTSEHSYVALSITKKEGILLAVHPQHRRGDRASSNGLADVLACQTRRWFSTQVQNTVDVQLQGLLPHKQAEHTGQPGWRGSPIHPHQEV